VRAAVVAAAAAGVGAALATATGPLPRLDLDDAELTARGERYRKLLQIVDEPFEVHDLSGLLGLPTFALTTAHGTAACASDLEPGAALERALEQTLLAYQSRAAGQPGYAPEPAPRLPDRLRRGPDGTEGGAEWPAPATLDEVVARLTRAGGRVVVVPLDHDPAVARLCPFVAQATVVHG
jgi:hypothetical protein